MTDPDSSQTRFSLRSVFGGHAMHGPGKAAVPERIRDTGSIAAAEKGRPEAGQAVPARYRSLRGS